jgi:hypothetical protein
MTYITAEDLVQQLLGNKYSQVSELLNTSNKNLFIGPNNLLDADKIESAKIYTKLIYDRSTLDQIYPQNESDPKFWAKSSEIRLLEQPELFTSSTPISNHMIGVFKLGRNLTSHMHIVHGGAIASLIDEYFVKVVLPLTPNNFAVTANLNIKYLKPIKFQENERIIDVILDCFIVDSIDDRKFNVKGSLMDLKGNKYCIGELLVAVPREPL